MKIGIIGTGYVGLVTGTCLGDLGHEIRAIDSNAEKVLALNQGHIPIYEPGLEELLKPLLKSKKLIVSGEYSELSNCSVVFVAVGTPSRNDGSADLSYVFSSIESLARVLPKKAIIVLKSTVPIGTAEKVKNILEENRSDISVVSNPEFLKEGSAIDDFMNPDRIIVGAQSEEAFEKMDEVYLPFLKKNKNVVVRLSNISAELTKYAANCFLATKISYINEMASLCDRIGANIEEIKLGIGSDPRIGNLFLNPGPGYGGSCFPKDVKALIASAKNVDQDLLVVTAAEEVNKLAKLWAVKKCESIFSFLNGKTLAIWGLSFKANTDDVRESASIDTITYLLNKGVSHIFAYDSIAGENFSKNYGFDSRLKILKSFEESQKILEKCDGLIIMTEWEEFKKVSLDRLKVILNSKPIIDSRNLFSVEEMKKAGLNYYSLGRPSL